ncbi:ELM1/GtrOC1 family putative glycosyltransferase [Acinetobacter baumannii]|uniref:ELM1/GtrOC1 family putative glycosyltransferase n=1 Tax=Acinetobacter baumannii TaxID=470 RepID=UPI0033901206|nr:mitochondrial fission ELM1 family protein [Acinetobacter baumannii]
MTQQKPFLLALTDGKAGHETQTQGIVQLLNQQQEYQVEWVQLNLPKKWLYRVLKLLIKFSINTQWLRYFFDAQTLRALEQKQVAYIVSAGGNTLLANLLLKQHLHKDQSVKNLAASSLRGIRADLFDVVFTILEQQAVLPHYFYYPIAPNKMSALPLTHEQALEHLGIQNVEQTITILIGADTKTVKIGEAAQWANVLQQVRKQYPTARLLLTTSRRTSVTFEKELQKLAEQYGIFQPYDQLTWVAQGQSCDIKDYIKAADWVLTSSDSTSMVAEVVMSGSKLLVLYNEAKIQDPHIKQQLKFLAAQRWLYLLDLNQKYDFSEVISALQAENHTEAMTRKLAFILDKQSG